jgi:hypothetical protein
MFDSSSSTRRRFLKTRRATSLRRNRCFIPVTRAQTVHADGDWSMISVNLPKVFRPDGHLRLKIFTMVSSSVYPLIQRHEKNIIAQVARFGDYQSAINFECRFQSAISCVALLQRKQTIRRHLLINISAGE